MDENAPPGAAERADTISKLVLAFRPPDEESRVALTDWGSDENLDRSRTEYTRLFVTDRSGPAAPPEALAWLREKGGVARTIFLGELAETFENRGLVLRPEVGRPSDHLTVLLEFLHFLESTGASAEEGESFAARFLDPWVGDFLDALEAADPPPLWHRAGRELARLLAIDRHD